MDGLGVMIHRLGGGSKNSALKYYGRLIKRAVFDEANDKFTIQFTDGIQIDITDAGQSCCEERYMTCDDDPKWLEGKMLTKIFVQEADHDEKYGCHDLAFLELHTDQGSIQFVTHNKHNGYYGGFALNISESRWM